jgi:hypothetical protein
MAYLPVFWLAGRFNDSSGTYIEANYKPMMIKGEAGWRERKHHSGFQRRTVDRHLSAH